MSQDTDRVLEGTTRPLPRMRRTAARRLTEAWSPLSYTSPARWT
jgi:hypothetical protein